MAVRASILPCRWRSRQPEDLPLTGFHEVPIRSKEPLVRTASVASRRAFAPS